MTTQYEDIWFNEKAGKPFNDKNLRAAFSYAFDRKKFLNDIVKPFDPTVTAAQLRGLGAGVGNWCDNTDVRRHHRRPGEGRRASWRRPGYAKDASGIWAKGGKELVHQLDGEHREQAP